MPIGVTAPGLIAGILGLLRIAALWSGTRHIQNWVFDVAAKLLGPATVREKLGAPA